MVGVADHLAAYAGLLEDVHRLQQLGIGEADVGGDRGHLGRAGEVAEDRVEIVHRVPDLVDRQREGPGQLAIDDRAVLEEPANRVARPEEPRILGVALVGGGEDADRALGVGVDVGQQLLDVGLEGRAPLRRHEAGQHQEAVALPGLELLGGEHAQCASPGRYGTPLAAGGRSR